MVASDKLLQLIAKLQRDMTVQEGRRTLLRYARNSTGAHLALLFLFDKGRKTLTLLERSGRRSPQRRSASPGSLSTSKGQVIPRQISAQGLFGSALQQRGLLYLSSTSINSDSLQEERYWIGRAERVILSALGEEQGVLVLCFASQHKTQHKAERQTSLDEGNLLVCTTLLAAYLYTIDEKGSKLDKELVPGGAGNEPTPGYQERLQTALDRERRRIAHDLHDGVAQQLAHVIHKLEFIQLVLVTQPDVALREIVRTAGILKASLQELRHGISSLLPAQLEEQGFEAALQNLLDEYTRNEPMQKIKFDVDDMALVPLSLEAPIFRFIQEALNNVRKHAQASYVWIRMRILAGLLVVEVSDNGRGFDAEEVLDTQYASATQHIGLRAMRDRIVQAGGSWEIQSKRGEGTAVRARFPLTSQASALTQRERDVLRLLVQGLTNRAIAEKLSVSTETVKSHVQHIMQKMRVNDRTLAAVIATKQQWL